MSKKLSALFIAATVLVSCKMEDSTSSAKSECLVEGPAVSYIMDPSDPNYLLNITPRGKVSEFASAPAITWEVSGEVIGKSQGSRVDPTGHNINISANAYVGLRKDEVKKCSDESIALREMPTNPRPQFCMKVRAEGCGYAKLQLFAGDRLLGESDTLEYCGYGDSALTKLEVAITDYDAGLGNENIHPRVVQVSGPVDTFVSKMRVATTWGLTPDCQ